MIDEERLGDLLLAWEERLEYGHDLAADVLCQNSPDLAQPLAERIAALKRMNWLGRHYHDKGFHRRPRLDSNR